MTRVVFSVAHDLKPVGPGRPLSRIHQALTTKYANDYTNLNPAMFPEMVEVDRLGDGRGPCYDQVAAEYLNNVHPLIDATIFIGGGGSSLQQIRSVYRRGWLSITLWFSSYWKWAQETIGNEYKNAGIQQLPIHPFCGWMADHEQEASSAIIVPSEFCANTYPKNLQPRVRVAEFGVDVDEFPCRTLTQPDTTLRVLAPMTNPYRKGLHYLLQAINGTMNGRTNITITGSWKGDPQTRNNTTLTALGWIDDAKMKDLYLKSDLFISPSLEEGEALASIEAAASGLPLIITPNTGTPIQDGKQGLIIKPKDPKAIADALQYFTDNPSECVRMGREARAWAEQRPWTKFTDRVIDIIEEQSRA